MMQTAPHWSLVAPVSGADESDERVQVYRVGNPCWIENWVHGSVVEGVIAGVDPDVGAVLVRLPNHEQPGIFQWDQGVFARRDYVDSTLKPSDVYET